MAKGASPSASTGNNKKATKTSASAIVKGSAKAFPTSPTKAVASVKTSMVAQAAANGKKKPANNNASAAAAAAVKQHQQDEQDREFLRRAINLSQEHMRGGAGGPFGAIVVKDGEVVAEGWNQVTSTNDPTAHGEVVAIRRACAKLKTFSLKGCALYTSCEPCPMCLASIYWARLDRIVFANTRDQAKAIGFDDAYIYDEIPLPIDKRAIPHRHMPLDEAWAVFQEFQDKTDKIAY